MTDEDRAEFRLYMKIMNAWGRFVVPLRPADFSALIDIKDAVAVIQGRACCVWCHNPECRRSDMEELAEYHDDLTEENLAVLAGRACSIWYHRSECYANRYPHLADFILDPLDVKFTSKDA